MVQDFLGEKLPSHACGTLYVVPLPIGNPKDISLRALETLNGVDVIAAEDTRTFNEVARQLQIAPKKVVAHHEHNEAESAKGLLALLLGGQSVAITTDAGTPNLSDPGYRLLHEAFENGIKVVPLPGASALTTAVSAAPIGGRKMFFGGFAPATSGERVAEFKTLFSLVHKAAYFEAPHRLVAHLEDALAVFGNTEVCIARELTKTYEELRAEKLSDAVTHFKLTPPKGEFVVIYNVPARPTATAEDLQTLIRERLNEGRSPSDIVKEFQGQTELKKKQLYDLVLKLKNSED